MWPFSPKPAVTGLSIRGWLDSAVAGGCRTGSSAGRGLRWLFLFVLAFNWRVSGGGWSTGGSAGVGALPRCQTAAFSATGGAIASLGSLLPAFGETIRCPCCDRSIPALVLTNAYLCPRHGLFEVAPAEDGIIHLDSGRHWRSWQGQWYRQHQQIESLRTEIFAGTRIHLLTISGFQGQFWDNPGPSVYIER